MFFRVITILAVSQFEFSDSESILFYHAVSSYSHRIAVWPWVESLAARGHKVTFLQPYPPKHPNPNVTEFYPQGVGDMWALEDDQGQTISESGFLNARILEGPYANLITGFAFSNLGLRSCRALLSNPEMMEFVSANKFDLVIVDFLFNECAYGLAHQWGSKTILYYSTEPSGSFSAEPLGFTGTDECSLPGAWNDNFLLSFLSRMSFALITTYLHLNKEWNYYPKLHQVLRSRLDSNIPPMRALASKTDLVLYNSHFSEAWARTLPPLFIPVPAMHAWGTTNSATAFPKQMAKFIEDSSDGFVYVSFGSLADINTAPRAFQTTFINAFARSKTRFLWKIDGEITKEMPSNVFTAGWMPQKDILASPNCKAFIGHGGLLGTQEALMHGIPMIVFPIFGEQDFNAWRIAEMGRGIVLEVHTITEDQLGTAIQEILTNTRYKATVDKVSKQLRDQQNSPVDTAVYWTEYVLRHDRADLSRLRPQKWRHYWFQVTHMDIWLFLGCAVILTSFITLRISKGVVRLLCRRNITNGSVKLKRT